jgi:hypothetical protein
MTTVAATNAYLLSTPVEHGPNARRQARLEAVACTRWLCLNSMRMAVSLAMCCSVTA